MSNQVFVVADLHFGHAKVATTRGFASVEEHDNAIVKAWNRAVTKRDVVYVLGDVFRLDRVPELNGTKKLAMGNHDNKPVLAYAQLFSQVRGCYEFDGCLLSHIPVHPGQFCRYELNVHGHTHDNVVGDLRYLPVSIEHCPYQEPALLRELIRLRRDRLHQLRAGPLPWTHKYTDPLRDILDARKGMTP